jgi:alkanesulfonate monooxygenase SsuD/methylene tetrahydromethanopterin reductase-like flavin-dependent oxidoreductase (luciferase family)
VAPPEVSFARADAGSHRRQVRGREMMEPMRVGVSMRSGYGVDDVRVGARWMVERARAARDAGLDSLFLGDHHVTGGPYYQNPPTLGRLLAEWGDRPSGALYLLPLWHPVLLAEQVGTLAAIAEGPFVLQCALGADEHQFAGMGTDLASRRVRFEAGLDIARRLLAGEEVTVDDGPWPVTGARTGPQPPEPVEVWIAGGAPPAIDRAARLGAGWVAWPGIPVSEAAVQLRLYRERCQAHGRPVGKTVIRRDIHVGADHDDARRVAGPVIAGGYRGFAPDVPVVGDVAHVAEQFRELGELGYTDVLIRHLAEDHGEVLASFERLAEVRALVADA